MKQVFLLLIFVLVTSSIAYACTCTQRTHRYEYREAAAVFSGVVVEVREDTIYHPPKLFPPGPLQKLVDTTKRFIVRFKILHGFKGTSGKEFSLINYVSDGPCSGYKFDVGEKWLVYVTRKDDELVSGYLCSRTSILKLESDEYREAKSFWFRLRSVFSFGKLRLT